MRRCCFRQSGQRRPSGARLGHQGVVQGGGGVVGIASGSVESRRGWVLRGYRPGMGWMRVTGCVLGAGLLLGGCGGGGGGASASSPSASVSGSVSPSPEEWEKVPAHDQDAFLAVLERADPGLVDGHNQRKRGLRRAVYTCRDIEDGLSGNELAVRVSQRFTGGQWGRFGC